MTYLNLIFQKKKKGKGTVDVDEKTVLIIGTALMPSQKSTFGDSLS